MINNKDIEQRSPEWHHIRKGKITGTQLKSIMGTPKARQDAIYEIIAERLTIGIDDGDENAMDRGVRLEDTAIAEFELETGLKVDKTGFSQNDDNPMIANSPDGWIGDSAGIEVKCPGGKNHVKVWLTNKIPDEYYWQCVQYFVVNNELEDLYFVSYNPDIPTHSLHIIKVARKEMMVDVLKAKSEQDKFIKEVEILLDTLIEL